jgi:hypothetical protein
MRPTTFTGPKPSGRDWKTSPVCFNLDFMRRKSHIEWVKVTMKINKLKISTISARLLPVFLILFLGVLAPLHHHEDSRTHQDDCAICSVSNQPFVQCDPFQILILFVVFYLVTFSNLFRPFSLKVDLHLRGPPVL